MRPEVWEQQKVVAKKILPAVFADVIALSFAPFIQAITDVAAPQASFYDGKLVLVGDGLTGFRPHVASSTGQVAFDALLLAKVVKGELDIKDWEQQVLEFGQQTQKRSIDMGNKNQFNIDP